METTGIIRFFSLKIRDFFTTSCRLVYLIWGDINAQNSCENPEIISPPLTKTDQLVKSQYWYEFVADSNIYTLQIYKEADLPFTFDSLILYDNFCGNQAIRQFDLNQDSSILWINDTGLIKGQSYKVKISQPSGDTSFYKNE